MCAFVCFHPWKIVKLRGFWSERPEAEKRGLLKRDMLDVRSEKKLTAGVSMIR